MEVAQNTSSTDINLAMGKATPGVSAIEVDYIKQYSNTPTPPHPPPYLYL